MSLIALSQLLLLEVGVIVSQSYNLFIFVIFENTLRDQVI